MLHHRRRVCRVCTSQSRIMGAGRQTGGGNSWSVPEKHRGVVQMVRRCSRRLESFQRASRNRRSPLTCPGQSELFMAGPPFARAMGLARDCNACNTQQRDIVVWDTEKLLKTHINRLKNIDKSHPHSDTPDRARYCGEQRRETCWSLKHYQSLNSGWSRGRCASPAPTRESGSWL